MSRLHGIGLLLALALMALPVSAVAGEPPPGGGKSAEPAGLKPGDRLTTPVTQAQKALWENQAKPASSKIVQWLSERLTSMGLSPKTEQVLSFAVAMGVFLFIVFNMMMAAGLLMWLASKIARPPECSFRKAGICTVVEGLSIVGLIYGLGWVLNYLSDIQKFSGAIDAGGAYVVVAALVFVDLVVLRIVYRVGWVRSLALSVSRLVSMAGVCAVLFGIAAVVTQLGTHTTGTPPGS